MRYTKSNQLRKIAHKLIPGGAHTYSKGDDQFPALSPGFIAKGKGAYVWDLDGNKFLDWGMGLRTVILGYGYKPVVEAVKKQIARGVNFSKPSALEVELAKQMVDIIPCAEMVKFAKNGHNTTTAAVKLARAYTKRDMIAMPAGGYSGSDDWCITTTVMKGGIPKVVQKLTVTFNYNDIKSVENLFQKYPNKIACVILEPATATGPKNNFLAKLKKLCKKNSTVLIFDEIITGFRWHLKGAQHVYKVTPDLATFGKAIANGFSLAVLVGRRDIMKLGGIYGKDKSRERVFLLSTTHGAETHTLAAAVATIKELKEKNVAVYINQLGEKLKEKLNKVNKENRLEKIIKVAGDRGGWIVSGFRDFGKYSDSQIKTYFFQELISQGILFNGFFSPSFSHGKKEIELTVKAWDYACQKLKSALDNKDLEKKLVGEPVKPVLRKHN